jgi:hypothetical protein
MLSLVMDSRRHGANRMRCPSGRYRAPFQFVLN